MALHEEEQILCILFCDLKDYSRLKDNDLKNKVFKELRAIFEQVSEQAVQVVKSTGDGLMACSLTSLPLAVSALQFRDRFKATDWKAKGFPDDLQVRIGLHVGETIVYQQTNGTFADLVGGAVDVTSRIEGATDSNTVFCSRSFHDLLSNTGKGKVRGVSKGNVVLPKQFGEMELFELVWAYEVETSPEVRPQTSAALSIPMPSIRKPFKAKNKRDFIRYSFGVIRNYFDVALKQLEVQAEEIETATTTLSDTKFTWEIYMNGELKTCGKIWISSFGYSPEEQIQYSEGRFHFNNDNAYNDAIVIEDDGEAMYLRSTMGLTLTSSELDPRRPSTPEQIAQYLWLRQIRILE